MPAFGVGHLVRGDACTKQKTAGGILVPPAVLDASEESSTPRMGNACDGPDPSGHTQGQPLVNPLVNVTTSVRS